MATGFIYLKIRLRLNQDLEEDDVQDLVETFEYDIRDHKGRIQTADVVAYSEDGTFHTT